MKSLLTSSLVSLILLSCGPGTYITSSWHGADTVAAPKKIVVLALVNSNNQPLRALMEQHLAAELKMAGYDAVCACEEFNPRSFENMPEDKAIDYLKNAGAGSVLTVVMQGKSQRQFYFAGDQKNAETSNRFFGYYKTVADRLYTPGYYVNETKYYWQTNFYNLGTGMLVYTASSKSADPVSIEKMGNEYGRMIVKDMISNHVLGLPEQRGKTE